MNEVAIREAPAELSIGDLKNQVGKIQQVMREVMHDGEHYGTIPGTDNKKKVLLKPGAEKLALVFRLAPSFDVKRTDMPNNHREYEIVCTLTHITSGKILGQGVGSCSTMETKYRYRQAVGENTGRGVPKEYWNLKKAGNIARAEELLGGKDFTTKKIDGNWMIVKKADERMENPDIADVYNTVLKMAKKRAQIDATLTATAASDFFTQDIGDDEEEDKATEPQPQPAPPIANPKDLLRSSLLNHCNGDVKGASQILQQLTEGKHSRVQDMSMGEIVTAQRRFEMEYLALIPDGDEPQEEGR
jgi:hypothetical protein